MSELNLKLPEPLKVDKNISSQLNEVEKTWKTIFAFSGVVLQPVMVA